MKTKLISLLMALVMLMSMAACGSAKDAPADVPPSQPAAEQKEPAAEPVNEPAEPEEADDPDSAPNIFVDDTGREVQVPGQITRIVPSGPLAQIVLFAIAPDMFVGLASHWDDGARGIIPEAYFDLPYFGQLYGSTELNVEELALADPQIIIDIGDTKDAAAEDLDTLQEQTTIPSVFISATLETMPDTYRKLGALLGKQEQGEKLAEFCERVYDRAMEVMEQVGDNKVNTLCVLGEEGLNVLAATSYHAELLDMLTNNLAVVDEPSSRGLGNSVDMEQIAVWNPDFILFEPDSIYDTVADMDTWGEITAVANGNYVEIPNGPHNWMGMPPSVQRYLSLIWLPAVLYPDYCDYDVKAEVQQYYKLFYGAELTEEQYDTLTANAFLK